MIFDLFAEQKNHIFSVWELNLAAKQLVEKGLPLLWVGGEISNFVCASSGHWYFSLKDDRAQVRCVMFRHKSQFLDWQPKNGMQIEVLALPTLYEARGDFQLTLEQMRRAGLGVLYEAFERLKRKLEAEQLFEESRKRPLPFFPKKVGVITSPQAAALRDVLTTLANRMPAIPVLVYPTPVQGEGTAQKIAQVIQLANERAECEVLILCRGGGSIEDLWAFNEEVVARAIAASQIPIVSGIGHETDFTIADFVADQRAATPTAAAQRVVPEQREWVHRLQQLAQRLARGNLHQLERVMQQLDYLQRRLIHPAQRERLQIQHLERLQQRLERASPDILRYGAQQTELLRRLQEAMQRTLEGWRIRLGSLRQHLHYLDPQQVLARGYSIVRDAQGELVIDSMTLPEGSRLDITFARGWAQAELKEKG